MSRLILALLLLFGSAWPAPAMTEAHAPASEKPPEATIRAAQSDLSSGIARSVGGWELLQLPGSTLSDHAAVQKGGGRRPLGHGYAAPQPGLTDVHLPVSRASDPCLGAGVLFLRLEHLPFYAAAPPFAR